MAISFSASFAPSEAVAADTVKLSQAARIHFMKQQVQATSQIASDLDLSVSVVDGYLGVAASKTASSSAAATAAKPVRA
jgi:hypothetical protein